MEFLFFQNSNKPVVGVMKVEKTNIPIIKNSDGIRCEPCLSVFICVGILAVTWVLWQSAIANDRINLESQIKLRTERVQARILEEMRSQIEALVRMAKRWEFQLGFSKYEWEEDAKLYTRHFPFYRAIVWVDEVSVQANWVIPGNNPIQGLDLFSQERKTIDSAEKYNAEITPIIDLGQGEKGFLVYVPIVRGSGKEYIIGVFQLKKWLDDVLSDGSKNYTVSLREKGREIYRLGNGMEASKDWSYSQPVNFFGNLWQISVAPTGKWVGEHRSPTPNNMFLFGVTMAFLLPLLTYLAQRSKYHEKELASANRELAEQLTINKLTEEFTRASETNYRNIMTLIPDMVYRLDPEGRFTYVSPGATGFGFEPEYLIGKHFDEIVHPDDRHIARYRFNEKRTGERVTQRAELRILVSKEAKDCELVETPVQLSAAGIYQSKTGGNGDSVFSGTQGIIRDITEQKRVREWLFSANDELERRVNVRTEALIKVNRNLQSEIKSRENAWMAVQESEQRLLGILGNAPMIIFLKDLKGRYRQINRHYETIMNMKEADILDKTVHDLFPMETANKLVENDRTVLESGEAREFEETILTPNGPRIFLSIKFLLHDCTGKPYALCGLCSDITERKQAEAVALRYARILDNSFNEIYIFDSKTFRFIHVSAGARENLGYTMEELAKLTPLDLKPEYSRETFADLVAPLYSGEKPMVVFEALHKRRDGTLYPVEVRLQLSATETPPFFLAIVQDITERKQAEDALQKSYKELEQAQKIARLGNWVWSITKNDLHWSDEIYRIFGLTPQKFEATYEAFLAMVHPLDRDFVKKSVNDSLHNRTPYSIDHRIVLPDGSTRMIHEQAEVDYNEDGEPVRMVGTSQDITEQHQVRMELENSRKRLQDLCAHLESVREEERSRIAREVHDELGQKLTALKIDIAWIKRRLAENESAALDKLQSMSALVDTTIGSVQKITAELRPQILDILGLFAAIEWEAKEFEARTGVKCWLNMRNDVKMDKQRSTTLFRIFQESMTNVARHANASNVHVILKEQEKSLFLEIRDDGKGITPDRISNSKSFGLIGIQERVFLLGGDVAFSGSPEKGTSVTIKLPRNGK